MKPIRGSKKAFVNRLRAVGKERYHHNHPFHLLMNAGELSRAAIRVWVANRFYYQKSIPLKDAAILSNCPILEVRRLWLHRGLLYSQSGEFLGQDDHARIGGTPDTGRYRLSRRACRR